MAEHTDGLDVDPSSDLLTAASRRIEHARTVVDLVTRQVSLTGFLPPTDYQVHVTAQIARTFNARLVDQFLALAAAIDPRAKIGADQVPVINIDPDLIATALARADEHWIAKALPSGASEEIDALALGSDVAHTELAFELLRAMGHSVDDDGDPLLMDEDVDYRLLERLIWRTAAEVRPMLEHQIGDIDVVDRMLTDAAKQFLGPRRRRPEPAADRLAQRLLQTEFNFPALLFAALSQAQPRLFCALIATRLELPSSFVMPALTQPERLALLLKAAGLSDRHAANILLELSLPLRLEDDRLIAIVVGFQSLASRATIELLRQMRLNPHYRAAIFDWEKAHIAA